MMQRSLLFGLIGMLLMTACATTLPQVSALFVQPEKVRGEHTHTCGFLQFEFENHNYYPSAREAKDGVLGVGIAPGNVSYQTLQKHHSRYVCLAGRVRYSGCTETSICSASNFPYEVVVDEIGAN